MYFQNPPEPSIFPWLLRRVVTAWELVAENRMSTSPGSHGNGPVNKLLGTDLGWGGYEVPKTSL